ncbi:MAG: anhydro-N-acetylmuramic acid kinase [Candidatus Sericytochromatia bacterium]|nr:anhydro-N-acetylmuramic acid kinase [Candidatus Sericytochromatia bacterium]
MPNRMRVLGLMSGTSADGVDVAQVLFWTENGRIRHRLEGHLTVPHPEGLGARIRAAGPQTPLEEVARLDVAVAESLAAAVLEAQATWRKEDSGAVDLIGSHGQTVLHLPGIASIQIGTPARIAALTGVTTVGDFRTADLAVGGQGAPLVPHADEVLYGSPDADELLLNLGGIANLTALPAGGPAAGWDTGPANMVLDGLAMALLGTPCDRDGAAAARGQVHEGLLARLLDDSYFVAPAPKSTGRERFGASYVADLIARGQALGLSTEDMLATATALTVQTVVRGFEAWRLQADGLLFSPGRLRVAGGGVRNATLMAGLRQAFADRGIDVQILPDAEAREAVAFALFAYEAVLGRANHAPSATGAHRPVLLGTVAPGGNYQRLVLAMPWLAASSPLPVTERRHPATYDLDRRSGPDLAELFAVEEDAVARALRDAATELGQLIEAAAARFARGGRLIYLGAGTSGRLGVLDAAECPPTFSTNPDRVLAFIAGGPAALLRAVEGAEDQGALGVADLEGCGVGPDDTVVGLSASGGAAYVREGLACARRAGALTALVTCVPQRGRWEGGDPPVDHLVTLLTGPELLTGSTRLKAGTATKVALNAVSTGVMVLTGKTWGNLMVDVSVSNVKLRDRAIRIVAEIAGRDRAEAQRLLDAASGKVRLAAAMGLLGTDAAEATRSLDAVGGRLALLNPRR